MNLIFLDEDGVKTGISTALCPPFLLPGELNKLR